jgi:hypothetical protein
MDIGFLRARDFQGMISATMNFGVWMDGGFLLPYIFGIGVF